MDRRLFLGSVGAIGAALVLPNVAQATPCLATNEFILSKWKTQPVDVTFVEHLDRWIPNKWIDDANIIGSQIAYNLADKISSTYSNFPLHQLNKCHVFYDICAWRSMEHNWIGYLTPKHYSNTVKDAAFCTEVNFPMEDVKTKGMIMMGADRTMPYPHNDEWDHLQAYGKTVEKLINHQMKG